MRYRIYNCKGHAVKLWIYLQMKWKPMRQTRTMGVMEARHKARRIGGRDLFGCVQI